LPDSEWSLPRGTAACSSAPLSLWYRSRDARRSGCNHPISNSQLASDTYIVHEVNPTFPCNCLKYSQECFTEILKGSNRILNSRIVIHSIVD
jgi:hypothetical protein